MRSAAPVPVLAVLAALAPLRAQDPGALEAARGDLARLQGELLHSRDEVDRLLHLRLRHDLGLPVEDFAAGAAGAAGSGRPATSAALEESRIELQREARVTADLARRRERLEAQVQSLRARAEQKEPEPVPDWVAVPQPYSLPSPGPEPEADGTATRPPAAGPEQVPLPPSERPPLDLDPVRGQIPGSRDPGLVARALYRAARDLVATGERLRATGREGRAAELDALAAERLRRALDVLAPALSGEAPPYADLFCQGRCLEALFRIDERRAGLALRADPVEYQRREQAVRDPFLAITVRDVEVQGGAESLGRWGKAAQTALDHFRWINVHGGFSPSIDPASITWEGR